MGYFGIPFRNGVPIGLGSVVSFGAQQFDPSSLFIGGTAGTWYDPSDLSTMFDTSAGTTPVAMPGLGAPVPVGLMLDKSQGLVGLGTQLVVNGDFSTGDLTNWQPSNGGSFAISSNRLQVTGVGAVGTGAAYTLSTTAGVAYAVSFAVTLGTATIVDASMSLSASGGGGIGSSYKFINSNQTITYYFVATAATTYFQFLPRGTGLTAFIDDFSVKTLGPGNHAIAANDSTKRPVLMARVNLLTYSEEFDNGAWTKTNATITANAAVAPNGALTADKLIWANSATTGGVANNPNTDRGTATNPIVSFNLNTGVATILAGATAVSAYGATNEGNGWWRCYFTDSTSGQTLSVYAKAAEFNSIWLQIFGIQRNIYVRDSVVTTGDGTSGVFIWGADLRPANIGANVPAYQRIADANTYDTSGFPLYLRFDGIDDSMYTPANLNLSGTDKVAVFAGVRKLSDAVAYPTIAELSATASGNDGAFAVYASANSTPRYAFYVKGTAVSGFEPQTYAAPVSNVLACAFDIAGAARDDEIQPKINGVLNQTNPVGNANAGTGNFGTYPLYIGSRANSSLWLNGHLYSLAVVGSAVSAGNIAAMESWVAGRTGIAI